MPRGSARPKPAHPPKTDSPPFPLVGPVLSAFDVWMAALLSLLLVVIYLANGDYMRVGDSVGNAYLPVSLLTDGNLSFRPSEFPFLFRWEVPAQTSSSEGPQASKPKPARCRVSLLPLPLAAARGGNGGKAIHQCLWTRDRAAGFARLRGVAGGLGDLRNQIAAMMYGAKFAASCYVAASAGLMYLALRRWLSWRPAMLLTWTYGLGTCVWSMSSQTLWQHAPAHFFLALGLYAWTRVPDSPRRYAALLGFAVSCAVACRPATAVVVPVFAIFLCYQQRRALWPYLLAGLPVALALALYNAWYLGSPFAFAQEQIAPGILLHKTGSEAAWVSPLRLATLGLFFSPSRGMFIFSPVLLFALPGLVIPWYRRELFGLRAVGVCVLAIWGLYAIRSEWWAGWSYGYRYLNDASGPLVLLIVPAVPWLSRSISRLALFSVLLAWSVAVQFVGAYAYDAGSWERRVGWYASPPGSHRKVAVLSYREAERLSAGMPQRNIEQVAMDIDRPEFRYRLWSWPDSEIWFCIEHFSAERSRKQRNIDVQLHDSPMSRGMRWPE